MTDETAANVEDTPNTPLTRRDFLRASAVTAAATVVTGCASRPRTRRAPAYLPAVPLPERIRVGVIGCGGRGTGAARDCVKASPDVEIVALGDLFPDRLDACCQWLSELGPAMQVTSDRCFAGFDAYERVLACDVDLVILATPPGFRPAHLRAAIEAGKHVFMEKPVAVDPVGIRKMLAAGEMAAQRKLCVVAGTQRRHQAEYIQMIQRIHDGEIGRPLSAQIYWNGGPLPLIERKPGMSDDEWMHRDWFQWRWLSGDHVVEQHVHNMDVACWALKAHPIKASAMGGRHRRKHGDQYDVFAADVTFPGEIHVHSECRQIKGCTINVSERVIGDKGWSNCKDTICKDGKVEKVEVKGLSPYVQEHADLIEAIRTGKYINETKNVTEATMANIMIRESAYTGKEVLWDDLIKSDLELKKPDYELTPENILAHVPVPGEAPDK